MVSAPTFNGLDNYMRMFLQDNTFFKVLKNTLYFAIFTGPLSYLLSFGFAWLINELGRGLRTVLTFVFYAPVLSGGSFMIWSFLFSGDQYGFINGKLIQMGLVNEPIKWLGNSATMMVVLIIVQLWSSLSVGFLAFIAGFQNIDNSYFEAGAIDGIRNRWQELWYITIPQMSPQLMFGAVMQISATFGISGIITALAGFPTTNYSADTIVTYIMDIGTIRFEMGYACAIATFLFVMMLLVNNIISSVLIKYRDD
jgi:multiple sugar transport system permease protein